MRNVNTDVVVVGAGNAGLVSALSAAESGCNVIVLEAAPYEHRGGNTRFAGAHFRTPHGGLNAIRDLLYDPRLPILDKVSLAPYSEQQYFSDWMQACGNRPAVNLIQTVIRGTLDTMRWMKRHGVEWEIMLDKPYSVEDLIARRGPDAEPYPLPPGGAIRSRQEGEGLSARLFDAVERHPGISVWYGTPAHRLVVSGSSVRGVRIRLPNRFCNVLGTVVLASGGFEANPEMRLKYLGEGWDLVKVRGTRYNMGTMLTEALRRGAQPVGHWQGCHASPVDAAAPAVGDLNNRKIARYSYPLSLMVNRHGERFVDEGEDHVWMTYAKTGSAIRRQPGALAYQLFDQQTIHLLEPRYVTAIPVVASTIEELSAKLGIPGSTLEQTVDQFNASTMQDAGLKFDPTASNDGVFAHPPGQPPKSNWALPLNCPPFAAYSATCGITFTFGGISVNTDGAVIDKEGVPMPGLYAVGEITGNFFFDNYAGGSGLARGAVFGRIVGKQAASRALRRRLDQ